MTKEISIWLLLVASLASVVALVVIPAATCIDRGGTAVAGIGRVVCISED